MAQLSERQKALGFYVVVIVFAVLAWAGQSYMNYREKLALESLDGIAGQIADKGGDLEAKALDAFLAVNQQVTTLETALMGGVFYLLFNSPKGSLWRHRSSALVGALLISISIYLGFVTSSYFIVSLQNGIPDPTTGPARMAQQAHFYSFLLGVTFFANFIFHNLPTEDKA